MNEQDFQLVMRAKRQIQRELAMRSFLVFGLLFCAALTLLGIKIPFLYLLLFIILLISLVVSSELMPDFGMVSKGDLISVIEKHIHSDPEALSRYSVARSRRSVRAGQL